jgi:hypothetical protein
MTISSPLTYRQLITEANRLSLRMRRLHEALEADPLLEGPHGEDTEFDQMELIGLENQLYGIGSVLELLGHTPNAFVNPEAMDALREVVRKAAGVEQEPWAAVILDRVDPVPEFNEVIAK